MAKSSDGDRPAASGLNVTGVWRTVFDAVERPVTRTSERWVQSNAFMDALALAWRTERRTEHELRRGLDLWLGAWRVATRGDVDRLSGEVARVERELRALRRQLERQSPDAERR